MKEEKRNFLNKKIGTKLNEKKRKHDKFSSDNIVKKIKVQFMNFLIFFLNMLIKKKVKELDLPDENNILKQINVKYKENVTKLFNFDFLKQKVYIILSLNFDNIEIIQKYYFEDKIKEFINIMNMELIDVIKTIFLMSSNEFKKKYSLENNENQFFLFENLKEKEKEISKEMEKILTSKNSLLDYFKRINGRERRKNDFYQNFSRLVKDNSKLFKDYKLNKQILNNEIDQIIEKEIQKNLIKELNLSLNEEWIF